MKKIVIIIVLVFFLGGCKSIEVRNAVFNSEPSTKQIAILDAEELTTPQSVDNAHNSCQLLNYSELASKIDNSIKKLSNSKDELKEVKKTLIGLSLEGSEVTGKYNEEETLIYIYESSFGETYQSIKEYYFESEFVYFSEISKKYQLPFDYKNVIFESETITERLIINSQLYTLNRDKSELIKDSKEDSRYYNAYIDILVQSLLVPDHDIVEVDRPKIVSPKP